MSRFIFSLAILFAPLLFSTRAHAQFGHVLDAVGPINQSMGGAGTGLPLDGIGALHWNPASISGLGHSEMGFSAMAFAPETHLSSRVDANAFGPGFPPVAMSGTTTSDTDISPIPSFGLVHYDPNSSWTFGLGGFAIGGFGVDFPGSTTNPILTPQPPDGGMGFGPIYSSFQLMQFCPTASHRFGNGWSVGVAPTINWGSLSITPFSAASPNPDGSYSPGNSADAVWGLGLQTGVYYESPMGDWSFGASYKSPQWFQDFEMNTVDHLGAPRVVGIDLDYPGIVSLGLGYRGFEWINFAWDVRYIDYNNTDGFQAAGFDATGAVTGFGWRSIWTTSFGIEVIVLPRLTWRTGYAYSQSPIGSNNIFFNSPAPAILEHHLSTGLTCEIGDGWMCSLTYSHGFEHSITGPWHAPGLGPVPGTSVTGTLATYGLTFGVSRSF
ncbi:MAG: outer membrane protein transport protein [Planctomycetaceae bacterium]